MKYDLIAGALFVMLVSVPNVVIADSEQKEMIKREETRTYWADLRNPAPPGNYAIKIDDRVFSFTIPQERTAATYNRKDIDTPYYREQIFVPNGNYRSDRVVGLFSARRKDQTGIWPLVRSYGETAIGSGVFLLS